MIDTVHNTGLRLVTGAYRSSPIPSVLNTAPLNIRRVYSSMLLATRCSQNNLKISKQITDALKDISLPHLDVIKNENIQSPPWLIKNYVNFELIKLSKKDTLLFIYNQQLHSIIADFHDYTKIFTDGSKSDNGVGAAVISHDHVTMLRFPDFSSIYTAEAAAIFYALDLIKTRLIHEEIILNDS